MRVHAYMGDLGVHVRQGTGRQALKVCIQSMSYIYVRLYDVCVIARLPAAKVYTSPHKTMRLEARPKLINILQLSIGKGSLSLPEGISTDASVPSPQLLQQSQSLGVHIIPSHTALFGVERF